MWTLVEDLDVGVVMMCGLWVRQRLVVLLVLWAELSLREVRVWIPSRSTQEKISSGALGKVWRGAGTIARLDQFTMGNIPYNFLVTG